MQWIGFMATILWWSSVVRCLNTLNRGYKITPKPCRVAGPDGGASLHGTCMFVWECIRSQGTHVGVCVDTFMFGSCCVLSNNETTSTSTSTTTTNLVDTQQYTSSVTSTVEPSRLSDTTIKEVVTTTQRPTENILETTKPRPDYSSFINRPKRPHSPSYNLQSVPARLPDDGKTQTADQPENNQRMRPSEGFLHVTKPERSPSFTNVPPPPEPPSSGLHYITEKEEDNVITEIAGDRITAASSNSIRTEKPPAHWLATNDPLHGSTFYSSVKTQTYRPGSSSFNHHTSTEERPNFVSKPDNMHKKPSKVWTTFKPTSTEQSMAESLQPTTHWSVTTEPAFITKQKYPSSGLSLVNRPSDSNNFWADKPWTTAKDKRPWSNDGDRGDDNENSMKKPDQENTPVEYGKPHHGSANHYITTADLGSLVNSKPTRRRTPQPPRIAATTTSYFNSNNYNLHGETSTKPTTTLTAKTTTIPSTTTPMIVTSTTMSSIPTTRKNPPGSIPTISAVSGQSVEGKHVTQCGIPPLFPRPETRIVGGKDAPFGRWPWQVSVRRTSFFGFSSTHRCGGAVLNENWIATAGHCVDDLLTSQIRIRVGDYDFSSVQERLPYVERGIAKKVVHPKYNFFTYEYDLALVKLETSLVFAPHISPICLPATDDLLVGENATVTGWGRLSEGGTLPSVLQEVSVPIVSNDRCKSMFLRAGRHEFIPEIFLCAGYENGGQDSCQGDSGGPLQVRGKDGRYFLAGIISWGIGCAEANLPGVCTRISKFVPWILKNVS
ncbi:serine proteinase stubble isoform X2 [Chelonus insularis]|uniref:serine proteinase stubble isoform X2 n=1 Tax=Chelonus insularis TaxID=460826 RepID=UPI00158952D0|nr:serine proteinase stubble-like isoform X2 [Chelonus insularis]